MRLTLRQLLCVVGIVAVAVGFVVQTHATGFRAAIGFLGFASATGLVAALMSRRLYLR